ncbi:MAG: diguanylate cyclase [Betaproteobacteria bacterium]|nr:diguanylate cyclase [Betaproteobacteria bacterium]
MISRRAIQVAALALAAAMLVGFANVYGLDSGRHDSVVTRLREMQALDSELSETVLKLRYGLINNYDPPVAILQRLTRIKESLETGRDAIAGRGSSDIDAAIAQLSTTLQTREDLVERFKSHNALLRNSVLYLPLSVEKAALGAGTSSFLREKLHAVLREALLVQVGAARDDYTEVMSAIAALETVRAGAPAGTQADLERVLLHAQHIAQNQQRIDGLIAHITSAEQGHLGAELTATYNADFERALARSDALRFLLLLASLTLLSYAVYAFVRLRRNARMLTESETRYRSVVAAIAEGIVIRDAGGRIVACNASAERILGRSIAELRGSLEFKAEWEPIREDGSPIAPDEHPASVALRSGKARTDEVLGFRGRDGTVTWLSLSAQPLFAPGSAVPSGVVTSLVDITQRKQAQARLAMEHAITRVLAEADTVPAAMSAILRIACETLGFAYGSCWERDDRDDAIREVAAWTEDDAQVQAFAASSRRRLRTLRPEGLMGRVWGAREPIWFTDVTQEPTFRRAELAARAGLRGAFSFPIVYDGQVFAAIECFSRGTRAPDDVFLASVNAISGQIGLFMQRQKAEEKSQLAANAMKHTADGIAIYDSSRRIVFVNEAFSAITGYHGDEAIGKRPEFLRSGDDDALYEQVWDTVRETGHWRGEVKRRRKSGELYPELRSVSAVSDKGGDVTHYVTVFSDIARFKEYEARLQFLAHHDALTNLPNRVLFHDRCSDAFLRAQRHGGLAAVLFVDLDRFKAINDSLGHHTGDTLLQAVAARLRGCVRASDVIARAGGDEFTILLDELRTPEDAAAVAQKILAALVRPFALAGHELFVSASVGISCYPADGTDTQTLLKNADAAMYRAKEEGRDAYRFFSSDMNAHALETLLLASSLRQVLERDELLLHYQPRVELATRRVTGVEALVRWQRPGIGLVSPAQFIPLAEETGLIVPIGDWVIRTACTQLRAWQHAGLPRMQMAVNLSARQLSEPGIAGRIAAIISETDIDPCCLELEITESMVMQDPANTATVLKDLSAIGVSIAIDDFGTGYSSLSYLKRFPIDCLKIDQSFVRGVPVDADDAAITRTIVAMAKSLSLRVIAEGVEEDEQRAFLEREGCHEAQGYLFSKPRPAQEIEPLLRAGYIAGRAQIRADAALTATA